MSKFSRRQVLQASLSAPFFLHAASSLCAAPEGAAAMNIPLTLNAVALPPPQNNVLHMGAAARPDGLTLDADSQSLLRGGARWLPVMGEFHYARYPAAEWSDALQRMKAGGVNIASTYVFWIHHEETQGQWDWQGRRSLRGYAQACQDTGMPLIVRCGPWAHGEVRNGGFPDWVQHSGVKLRSTDPAFLALVRPLYTQIAAQLAGLLWKEGGPVIGIQMDNEYYGPAEYLLALKNMARDVGLDVPFYTRTGWPELTTPMPQGELMPLFGGYPDGFWDRQLTPMPGEYGDGFRFLPAPSASAAAMGAGAGGAAQGHSPEFYPYVCCEIGGGMETSYHRRIRIFPDDILSLALVKIGSGNNLQGYYMYHGGTNPDGKLSDLQETQATGGYNDLPVKTYDFFAPLGEFGQAHPHYHLLRRLHLFLADWGLELGAMPAQLPAITPTTAKDAVTLRWSARTDGQRGCVFVNNYQRLQSMPAKPSVQFALQLPGGKHTFPERPITIPADQAFFWPFGWGLGGGVTLTYATAQPVCRLEHEDVQYAVFSETPGIPAEFVFTGSDVEVRAASGTVHHEGVQRRVTEIQPGLGAAMQVQTPGSKPTVIVLLDEAQSRTLWKGTLAGRDHLFLSPADLIVDGDTIRLRASDPANLTVALLPAPPKLSQNSNRRHGQRDGLFQRFSADPPQHKPLTVTWNLVQAAGPAREILRGSAGAAAEPTDSDFDQAAVWRLHLPPEAEPQRDLLLRIHYVGDVARLYWNGTLLDDNFYNDTPFELGLRRYAPDIFQGELLLKILPLRKDAPIYLQAWPDFGGATTICSLQKIELWERFEAALTTA